MPFFADAEPLPGYPRPGRTIVFLGRYGEPRKGIDIPCGPLPRIVEEFPDITVLVVGGGNESALRRRAGDSADRLVFPSAPSTTRRRPGRCGRPMCTVRRISVGRAWIVLVEAMAAGPRCSPATSTRSAASSTTAGRTPRRRGSAEDLATGVIELLTDDAAREEQIRVGAGGHGVTTGRASPIRSCGSTRRCRWPTTRSRWRTDEQARSGLGAIAIVAIVVGSVLLVAIALWAYRVANRLDRLHVRTDLARQALVATLDRRAVVARAIAAALRAREEEDLDALGCNWRSTPIAPSRNPCAA